MAAEKHHGQIIEIEGYEECLVQNAARGIWSSDFFHFSRNG